MKPLLKYLIGTEVEGREAEKAAERDQRAYQGREELHDGRLLS